MTPSPPSGPLGGAPEMPCRVLLLSAHRPTLCDWQVILARLGPGRIATAGSVLDAFNQIARDRPRLVLADSAMPAPNGLTLARELRLSPFADRRTLVVLVGAPLAEAEQRQAHLAGIDQIVPGPLDPVRARELLLAASIAPATAAARPSLPVAIDSAITLVQAWALGGDEALLAEVIACISAAHRLAGPPDSAAAQGLAEALRVAEQAAHSWDIDPSGVVAVLQAARARATG